MKTTNLNLAENFRNRAFETAGTSMMIVMMEGFYFVTTRKEAAKLENQGYEVL